MSLFRYHHSSHWLNLEIDKFIFLGKWYSQSHNISLLSSGFCSVGTFPCVFHFWLDTLYSLGHLYILRFFPFKYASCFEEIRYEILSNVTVFTLSALWRLQMDNINGAPSHNFVTYFVVIATCRFWMKFIANPCHFHYLWSQSLPQHLLLTRFLLRVTLRLTDWSMGMMLISKLYLVCIFFFSFIDQQWA